jgi:hypothetical protein
MNDVELENTKITLLESCDKKIINRISSGVWKNCFPGKYKEIEYSKNIVCTFEIIIDIIEKKIGEKLKINDLKNVLYGEYNQYIKNYHKQIVDILMIEGKKTLGDQVNSNTLSFSSFIYSDNYFLTVLDLWILVNKYKIPTFFISTINFLQTNYEKNIFLGYSNDIHNDTNDTNYENEQFCFILVPALKYESVPSYKLLMNDKNEIFMQLKEVKKTCDEAIQLAFDNKINLDTYLQNFVKIDKPKKNTAKKLRNKLTILEDEPIGEVEKS